MVTQIHKGARGHLYLVEHRKAQGVSPEDLAARLGISRQSVHRWEREHHRMTPDKQAAYAAALGLKPADLWRPPDTPSIDALLANAPDDLWQRAAEMIAILLKTNT